MRRELAGADYCLMNLRLRRHELELQFDPKGLGKLFLLEHGFERRDVEF